MTPWRRSFERRSVILDFLHVSVQVHSLKQLRRSAPTKMPGKLFVFYSSGVKT